MLHRPDFEVDLPLAILDVSPNPVWVKAADLRYVWINAAFEALFGVRRAEVIGYLDTQAFPDREVARINAGDMRVLDTGGVEETPETVFTADGKPRDTVTRKSRLVLPDGTAYLVAVIHDITEMVRTQADLERKKAQLEEQARQLAVLANTDTLTGALTRRALYDRAGLLMGQGAGHGLLLLDIDHFKKINDTYGHAAGDLALVHFCATVRGALRDSDVLARMGGEEFAVFLPGATQDEMSAIGRRICAAVRDTPLVYGRREIAMTVSIGGTWHSRAEGNARHRLEALETALADADRMLYLAKSEGRDRMIVARTAVSVR